MKLAKYFYPGFAFLVIAMAVFRAEASTVVYEDFNFVSSDTAFTTAFDVTAPGLYRADLVDFEYPDAFNILALGITQGGTALGIGFGSGSFTFNVSTPGEVLAHLAAFPKAGSKGLYGLQILPIPIPPAIWLFLSGMAGIITIARRDRSLNAV